MKDLDAPAGSSSALRSFTTGLRADWDASPDVGFDGSASVDQPWAANSRDRRRPGLDDLV